jgi:hypothetical protein
MTCVLPDCRTNTVRHRAFDETGIYRFDVTFLLAMLRELQKSNTLDCVFLVAARQGIGQGRRSEVLAHQILLCQDRGAFGALLLAVVAVYHAGGTHSCAL